VSSKAKQVSLSKSITQRERRQREQRRRSLTRALWALLALAVVGGLAFTLLPRLLPAPPPAATSQDKSLGAAEAAVTLVEYGDFQCPACRQFAMTTARTLKQEFVSTGKVRFVYRHFAFLGPESQWAAEASECANEQGRFWEYFDALIANWAGENAGAFSRENLKRFATELGLEAGPFNECLDSGRYTEKVQQETRQGQQADVRGTPSLFLNDQLIAGGSNYEILKRAIVAALER